MKILFIDGTAGFAPTRLEERPCGGILTSLTIIPRFLAKNNEVFVLSLYDKEEKVNGVSYITKLNDLKPDVVVFNRNSIDLAAAQHFKNLGSKIVWWLHDIVDHRYLKDDGFKHADTVIALSEYQKASYSDFYGIPQEKFEVISNGVDKSVFYPGEGPRNKSLFVHASAPVKGTYPLPFAMHNLRRHDPRAEIRSYSSQKLHDLEDTSFLQKELDGLRSAGVSVLDPIPQKDLADVFRTAWGLLMPNHYPEECSNILLQAQACGLPVIASNIGSVSEFILHGVSGLLTHTAPHDMFWWHKDFAELCVDLQNNDELHATISRYAPKDVKSWENIGNLWENLLCLEAVS